MRRYVEMGGNQISLYDNINRYVLDRIEDSLNRNLPIHEYHLRQWGFERAESINASNFKASANRITYIKKKADIVGRKVTDYASRPDMSRKSQIEESKIEFGEIYRQLAQFFPHHRILNVDQSGHKYEISNIRSLARRGSRDHKNNK